MSTADPPLTVPPQALGLTSDFCTAEEPTRLRVTGEMAARHGNFVARTAGDGRVLLTSEAREGVFGERRGVCLAVLCCAVRTSLRRLGLAGRDAMLHAEVPFFQTTDFRAADGRLLYTLHHDSGIAIGRHKAWHLEDQAGAKLLRFDA